MRSKIPVCCTEPLHRPQKTKSNEYKTKKRSCSEEVAGSTEQNQIRISGIIKNAMKKVKIPFTMPIAEYRDATTLHYLLLCLCSTVVGHKAVL